MTEAANKRRKERSLIRTEIRAGRVSVSSLVSNPPEEIVELPVILLLQMIPNVGYVRIAELNYEAIRHGINICLPVGALTPRAKQFIVEWEEKRGKTAK